MSYIYILFSANTALQTYHTLLNCLTESIQVKKGRTFLQDRMLASPGPDHTRHHTNCPSPPSNLPDITNSNQNPYMSPVPGCARSDVASRTRFRCGGCRSEAPTGNSCTAQSPQSRQSTASREAKTWPTHH